MKMVEINPEGSRTALLVHPMLADSEIVQELIASRLGDDYRIFVPDLAGHGNSREYPFTAIAREADEIHTYLQGKLVFHLDFVWGASLGAGVALAYMRYVDASFTTLVLDGTPFFKAPRFVTNMIVKKMIGKHRKAIADPESAERKMIELYGECGRDMARELIEIDEESLRYVIGSSAEMRYPYLNEEQQENTHFIFGERDCNLKNARKRIPDIYPGSEIKVLPGLSHCEMIGKEPDRYVELIKSFIK